MNLPSNFTMKVQYPIFLICGKGDKVGNNVVEKAFEYVNAIAQQLGVAAEYVFTTLVKQKFIEGAVWSSILIVLMIVSLIVYKKLVAYAKTLSNKKERSIDEFSPRGGVLLASTLSFIFISLIVMLALSKKLMKVFNPEYYAIEMLLDMFKGV